jgi:uncharacterized membrane protein YphA (DoxX/SURF4 family)
LFFSGQKQGDSTLSTSPFRLGSLAIVAIVALRLAIGWHFFQEGAVKLVTGEFKSEGFMRVAKGPFAPVFKAMIWDGDGRARLNKEATLEAWNQYRQQVADHYGFDEQQAEAAAKKLEYREQQLETLFAEEAVEIDKYLRGLERRDNYRQDPMRVGVTSLRGQIDKIEGDMYKAVQPWLKSIDLMWAGLERDLNSIATPEQARRGQLSLTRPARRPPLDTVFIDQVIPTFDLVVGALLILGLFTRLSALAGAGFLAMIIATQWPGAAGAVPAHYQMVEMAGMLVLAAVGAGQFAGLDFLIHSLRVRWFPPRTERI